MILWSLKGVLIYIMHTHTYMAFKDEIMQQAGFSLKYSSEVKG